MDIFSFDVKNVTKASTDGTLFTVKGIFDYYHYNCDRVNDVGWGCGYRTLQSICSWIKHNVDVHQHIEVPSLLDIQKTLVKLEDKPFPFIGSKEWIGSVEVGIVIDELFNIPCKILHINLGKNLKDYVETICEHFRANFCPIMMGGDKDCSSKAIVGVHITNKDTYFLIVDPHFRGKPKSLNSLQNDGWVAWHNINTFVHESFYNLCLPQIK